MPKNIAFTLEIEVENVEPNSMFLHEQFASGTYGKTKFDVISILPSHSLVIEIKKKRYLVSNAKIVEAVVKKVLGKDK